MAGVVSLLDAIMGTKVDLGGLEAGLEKAERMTEEAIKKMTSHFNVLSIGIATAIAGTVLLVMEKAIKKTEEWGMEMEHLSNRMGMSVRETATLVGVMERFGVNAGTGARAMQMLSMQVQQTQNSLDPFTTRLGKTLGTLRDTNGQVLNMGQVLDLVRQKVAGAGSESERLQIATQLLGARIGGQLIPMLKLSNEEWEKQKRSVGESLGPVEAAAEAAMKHKEATEKMSQAIRGIQIAIGTALLPTLTEMMNSMADWITKNKQGFQDLGTAISDLAHPVKFVKGLIDEALGATGKFSEYLGFKEKGATDAWWVNQQNKQALERGVSQEEMNRRAADLAEKKNKQLQLTEQMEQRLVAAVKERVSLEEKSRALGIGGDAQAAAAQALVTLERQRLDLEKQLAQETDPDQQLIKQTQITKNRIEAAELVARTTTDMYKQEELQIKAMGDFSLSSEIQLLQKRLADEHTVGDERLKIEAELYQKRKQFAEDAMKFARQLGFASVEDEINYRKQRAAELLGKGDPLGAAGEIVKARDLAIKQADQAMDFIKKIRVVSLQSEMDYQKQKLEAVKGNAEEEMKIISQVADLDKQLYDKRLEFALHYTQNTIDAYRAMQKATGQTPTLGGAPGEVQTFAQAGRDVERARFQHARDIREVAQFGGTEEARNTAVKQAQDLQTQQQEAIQTGRKITEGMAEEFKAAMELLKAATGGAEVRAPGGPSPVVGSILSPVEGLSTSGLARGSDIPRLDTSFTDLSVRVRDVLLGSVKNVNDFSNAVAAAATKIAAFTGVGLGQGAIGPGGGVTTVPFGTPPPIGQTPGPATVAPGGVPTVPSAQIGISSLGQSDITAQLNDLKKAIEDGNKQLIDSLNTTSVANAESLQNALEQVTAARTNVKVDVGIDPGSGDAIISRILQEVSQ